MSGYLLNCLPYVATANCMIYVLFGDKPPKLSSCINLIITKNELKSKDAKLT